MTHPIYYGSIEEHLFLIEQLAHASLSCISELHNSSETNKQENWQITAFELERSSYEAWLVTIVSDYLIQCATKTRIIQDSSDFTTDDEDYCPDREAYEAYSNIAISHAGNVQFSLREICNKIIHAKKFELIFLNEPEGKFTYWGGSCCLHGDLRGKPWHVEINLKKWVLAMRFYYENIKHL
ncbi:hypothetical protein N8H22_15955 [Stutzerimonas stutzeri]|uniref:hypothetical protein n=1 Tax=Stutzerimonas sp. S1 TaxID=3030652 RepID=UPI00222523C1|nr:hypothetical protein [Stutzerimonas sp. S1]MCW3150100.1 hypothetical protein [Stutzerimonas sp. S1]